MLKEEALAADEAPARRRALLWLAAAAMLPLAAACKPTSHPPFRPQQHTGGR